MDTTRQVGWFTYLLLLLYVPVRRVYVPPTSAV